FDADAFDDWAGQYDAEIKAEAGFPFEGFSAVMNEIVQRAEAQPAMQVLDLGTGTGELAAHFDAQGCVVTATDFSTEMLKVARQKYPAIVFQFQDLRQPWPATLTGPFDRIVSAYVFHHFPLHRKVELIQEMSSHLNPAGRIIIGDLSFENAAHLDDARRHYGAAWDEELYWTADETLPALEQAGFQADYRQISYCAGVYTITPLPLP
ncbi:MAG: class I SAM-dependent methyltransferase, partial [Anaerolineaceae bacterium]